MYLTYVYTRKAIVSKYLVSFFVFVFDLLQQFKQFESRNYDEY